jgi:hypothetical protein
MTDVSLWKARKVTSQMQREQARALWRQGKLCGFVFNLQSAELFESCADFCISEDDDDAADVAVSGGTLESEAKRLRHEARQANATNEKLRRELAAMAASLREVQSLRDKLRNVAGSLADTQSRLDATEAENAALKAELDDERAAVRDLIIENRDLQRQLQAHTEKEAQRHQEAAFVNELFSAEPDEWRPSLTDRLNQRLLKSAMLMDFSRVQQLHKPNTDGDGGDDDDDDFR